jgi:hypothetical protein
MSEVKQGVENYRTHKFFEFVVQAPSGFEASHQARILTDHLQEALKEVYVLHHTVKLKTEEPSLSTNDYTYLCEVFARSLRSERKVYKHIRVREIQDLDIFSQGFRAGILYSICSHIIDYSVDPALVSKPKTQGDNHE